LYYKIKTHGIHFKKKRNRNDFIADN
jgi:hypothetical protein